MEKIRAGRLVELGRMVCEDAEIKPPQDGELLVRTQLASICGSDLHTVFMGVNLLPFPLEPGYPGHEGVDEVIESRHPDFAVGDQVLNAPMPPKSYTFSEIQTIGGRFCIKLPDVDIPPEQLMMAQQFGTVIFALRQRPVDVTGKTVMVKGQGSAGMFFAYLAKRAGAARVITSDLSEARLAQSTAMGADLAVRADGNNVLEAVMDSTGGKGADFVIEAVGRSESLLQSVDLVRAGGNLLMFGLPDTTEPVEFNFHDFFRKRINAHSTYGAQFEEGLVSFRLALDLIVRGEIDVSPLVSHILPIEEIGKAMIMANERTDNALKVSVAF